MSLSVINFYNAYQEACNVLRAQLGYAISLSLRQTNQRGDFSVVSTSLQ